MRSSGCPVSRGIKRRWRLACALGAVVLADLLAVGTLVVWSELGVPAQVIVSTAVAVLHADEDAPGENTARAIHAVLAVDSGEGPMLCIGGARPRRQRYWAEAMANALEQGGVARDRLHVDRDSYDTRSNVAAIARWQHTEGRPVVVLADAMHAVRVRREVERAGLLSLTVRPFSFVGTPPRPGPAAIWLRVHHEIGAVVLQGVLPGAAYEALLRWWRGQDTARLSVGRRNTRNRLPRGGWLGYAVRGQGQTPPRRMRSGGRAGADNIQIPWHHSAAFAHRVFRAWRGTVMNEDRRVAVRRLSAVKRSVRLTPERRVIGSPPGSTP